MEILKCEYVYPNGTRCQTDARWGCKFEKVVVCGDHLSEFHFGLPHERISKEGAVNLASFDKGLNRLLNLQAKVSDSGGEIISFVSDIIGNTTKNLMERERKISEIMTSQGVNQSVRRELNSISQLSLRLSNKDEIFKAIQYHFSENDGIAYKDIFKELLVDISKTLSQGNDQIQKMTEEISKNQDKNAKKTENIDKCVKQLEKVREEMKNQIKNLKNSLNIIDMKNKKETEIIISNCNMQINSLKVENSQQLAILKKEYEEKILQLMKEKTENNTEKLTKMNEEIGHLRVSPEEYHENISKFELETIEYLQSSANLKISPNYVKKFDPPIYSSRHMGIQTDIYRAEYKGRECAVKSYGLLADISYMIQRIRDEICIYYRLSNFSNHDNCFLKFYGFYEQGNSINLVMEYLEMSLMWKLTEMKNTKIHLNQEVLLSLFRKLLTSYAIMEGQGIYHGDIKPHNFLVDRNWNIKIIDYGISILKCEESTWTATDVHPIQGTSGYMAPELQQMHEQMLKDGKYRVSKSDVFSLGLVFLQMITLHGLYDLNKSENNSKLMQIIESVSYDWAKPILRNMLNLDPKKRHRFKHLLQYLPPVLN